MALKKPMCLTLREKSLVIEALNKGATVTNLSKKYGVAKSTVCKIKNNKQAILRAVNDTNLEPDKRKTLKGSEVPKMEKILYKWFLNQRNKNLVVSAEMIKLKAKSLHSEIRETGKEFTASEGWFQRFKKRYGIRFLKKISGDKVSSLHTTVDLFKVQLQNRIQKLGITLDQIYNANETGLYWKLLPDKTALGRKNQKQRITFLVCTNATGDHKIKPLVISKAEKPRSFKNFICPVDYEHSKAATMTSNIFKNWFHRSFVPQVKRFSEIKGIPAKALLLLNIGPSHPPEEELKSEDGQITTMYLKLDDTPLIQPMDQSIIQLTKLYYRNSLLSTIIAKDSNITDTLKSLTLKDAIVNLMAAWNRLDSQTIAKCWRNILEFNEDDDNLPLSVLELRWEADNVGPLSESLVLLRSLFPQQHFEEADILEWNRIDNEIYDEDSGTQEEKISSEETPNLVSFSPDSVINAFNVAIQWAEASGVTCAELMMLKNLRETAIMQKIKKPKKHTYSRR